MNQIRKTTKTYTICAFVLSIVLTTGFIHSAFTPHAKADTSDSHEALSEIVEVARWYDDVPGANRYRIPALTQANNGDLLAFFDLRPGMDDLPSNIGVSMRRSQDNGKTWGPIRQIRYESGKEGFGDPSVLTDRDTGRIFLFYAGTVNAGFARAEAGNDEADPNTMQVDYSYSDDNGVTWRHKRITAQTKLPDWGGIFAASGEGIQLRSSKVAKGRLIQQYVVAGKGNVSMYSDDHGDTWKFGNPISEVADENKVVELSDGTLMMSARAAGGMRKTAYSDDGGENWRNVTADGQQIDPTVNGTITRIYPDAPEGSLQAKMLMLLNSEDPHIRRNVTAKVSCDDGKTWPGRVTIDSGESEYVTGTPIYDGGYNKTRQSSGKIGVFFERDGYTQMAYTTVDVNKMNFVCAPLSAKNNGVETRADNRNLIHGGSINNYTIDITNQSGMALPKGKLSITGTDEEWDTVSETEVPEIASGASAKVTVQLNVPESVAGDRTLTGTYTAGGKKSQQYFFVNVNPKANLKANPKLKIETYLDSVYATGEQGVLGDEAVVWARVTNTGNVPITDIRVHSSQQTFSNLAACKWSNGFGPGEVRLCQGNRNTAMLKAVISQEDIRKGEWSPSFTVTGRYGTQNITSATSTVNLQLPGATLNASGISIKDTKVYVPTGDFQSSSYLRMNEEQKNSWILPAGQPLGLEMAKNNRTSAQLVVNSNTDGVLTAEVSEAKGITWEVKYPSRIKTVNSQYYNWGDLQETTDPLLTDAPAVTAGKNRAIWFVAHVDKNAETGIIRQTITLKRDGEVIASYPVYVSVRDVILDDVSKRPFILDLWWHPDAIADYYQDTLWSDSHFAHMQPYLKDLAAAGQGIANAVISNDPWLLETGKPQTQSHYASTVTWISDSGEYSFDWTVFDRLVQAQLDAGIDDQIHAWGFMTFRDPQRITYLDKATNQTVVKNVSLGSDEYKDAWRQFLHAFERHLKEKGWWEKTALAFDERKPAEMSIMKSVLDQVAPAWREKLAYATDEPSSQLDVSLVAYNRQIWDKVSDQVLQERRDNGKLSLLYTWAMPVSPNTLTGSPLMSSRMLGWDVARRNLDGYLRWTFNSWPEDVYNNPNFMYSQGDEYIVYPGGTVTDPEVVSSMRWETFKDGVDDAEIWREAKESEGADQVELNRWLANVPDEDAQTPQAWAEMVNYRSMALNAIVQPKPDPEVLPVYNSGEDDREEHGSAVQESERLVQDQSFQTLIGDPSGGADSQTGNLAGTGAQALILRLFAVVLFGAGASIIYLTSRRR